MPRTIAFQSALLAVGSGTFLTGSIVFFNRVLGLTPLQIGAGLSVAGLAGVAASLPIGVLADRIGGRRSWVAGAALEAAALASYPLARSFVEFVALMVATTLADSLASYGRTIYTADAIPAQGRVRTMAFARSYLNVGFTVGTGVGAAALAVNSTAALIGMVLLDAAVLLVDAAVVARLLPAPDTRHERVRRSPLAVLRDGPYVAVAVLIAILLYHAVIFTDIVPLWAITHTDAPRAILGALFALNTLLAVALQVPATRGTDSLRAAARLMRRAGLATAVACPVAALAGLTRGFWTIGALGLAVVLITATELWLSAAQWFIQTDVPPPVLRGSYVGMGRMISSIAGTMAPAGLTLLAVQTGGWGWWVIAAVFLACAAVAGPVVGWVARTPRVDGVRHHERPPAAAAPETAG
ncbi:MAG TPA: MFS transporter [Streptosporangiaceae bacterium]|nr:MFS transporter [Streptosporangiaceae bacterium]